MCLLRIQVKYLTISHSFLLSFFHIFHNHFFCLGLKIKAFLRKKICLYFFYYNSTKINKVSVVLIIFFNSKYFSIMMLTILFAVMSSEDEKSDFFDIYDDIQ